MNAKHTPGPWQRADKAHPGRGYGNNIIGPHGEVVASWNSEVWCPDRRLGAGGAEAHREAEANANLLTAAPDLLETLRWIGRQNPEAYEDFIMECRKRALAAIAKAEGTP